MSHLLIKINYLKKNLKLTETEMASLLNTNQSAINRLLNKTSNSIKLSLANRIDEVIEELRHRERLFDLSLLLPSNLSLTYRFAYYQRGRGWTLLDSPDPPRRQADGYVAPYAEVNTLSLNLYFMRIPQPIDKGIYYRRNLISRLWEMSNTDDMISNELVEKYREDKPLIGVVKIKMKECYVC